MAPSSSKATPPRFIGALPAAVVASVCLGALADGGAAVKVSIDTAKTIAEVPAEFLSMNLDASFWRRLPLAGDQTVDLLAKGLSPARLRVGGTQGDYDVYSFGPHAQTCAHLPKPMTNYRCKEVTESAWKGLLSFAQRNDLQLIYGLNAMFGRPTKIEHPATPLCDTSSCPKMNSSNLESLLKWTSEHQPSALFGLELGNELNAVMNGEAGAKALAGDFAALRALVQKLWPSNRPRILGPDSHSWTEWRKEGQEWLAAFAKAADGVVDAYTFHEYSLGSGSDLALADFLDPALLDKSGQGAQNVIDSIGSHRGSTELVSGETASANGGGAAGLTDTYVNGFWFLDQLGSHARVGVTVDQRQQFMQTGPGGYALVRKSDDGSVNPAPDYWLALLHKRLMGGGVLDAKSDSKTLRVYAHCAKGATGVVVAWINVAKTEQLASFPAELGASYEQWVLTPGKAINSAASPLQSEQVLLNGDLLALTGSAAHPALPDLQGKSGSGSQIALPKTSFGFLRFPDAKAAACQAALDVPQVIV